MTPRSASPDALGFTPIFNWSPRRSRKISLISFIVGSAVLHVLCFYVFQIVYPPPVALLPPPARVSLITAESEEGRSLLRWIEAEDPALSSTTQRGPDAVAFAPPKPEHVPTYLNRQAALKELPANEPDLRVPSSRPPGPAPLSRSSPPQPADAARTSIAFSPEAQILGALQLPELRFTASTKEPPQAAQFRVGISERGAVRHCFVQVSSGDRALDEQARRHLLLSRFSPPANASSSTVWAIATVEWGSDISAPGAAARESPPP